MWLLEENKDNMVRFSLEKLNEFCSNEEYSSYLYTLAMWPLELTKEKTEKFKDGSDLNEFEQILHEKQNLDVYYAKPRLLQNKAGEIGAFYIYSEQTLMDGLFNYEKFIQYFLDRGAEYYDNSRIWKKYERKKFMVGFAKDEVIRNYHVNILLFFRKVSKINGLRDLRNGFCAKFMPLYNSNFELDMVGK